MTTQDLDATHAAALAVTTCAVDAVLAPHRKIDYDMLNVALGDFGGYTADGKDAILWHIRASSPGSPGASACASRWWR